MQRPVHHSPQAKGSIEQAPNFDRLEKSSKRAPGSLMEPPRDVKAQKRHSG